MFYRQKALLSSYFKRTLKSSFLRIIYREAEIIPSGTFFSFGRFLFLFLMLLVLTLSQSPFCLSASHAIINPLIKVYYQRWGDQSNGRELVYQRTYSYEF